MLELFERKRKKKLILFLSKWWWKLGIFILLQLGLQICQAGYQLIISDLTCTMRATVMDTPLKSTADPDYNMIAMAIGGETNSYS